MWGITLRRYGPSVVRVSDLAAYRFRVTAVGALGFDGKVFVFSRSPVDPDTGLCVDTFETVAGPQELGMFPPDAPDPDRGPFFRKDEVELDCRSLGEVESAWSAIRTRVEHLERAVRELAELSATEEVRFGDPYGSYS